MVRQWRRKVMTVVLLGLAVASGAAHAATQVWQQGWDNFGEQLDLTTSKVTYQLNPATHHLKVVYVLKSARVNSLYQVGIHQFCTTTSAKFGRFGVGGGAGACASITRQGKTARVASVEFGAILTDMHGNGALTVDVGAVQPGTYTFEFDVRDGVGCNLSGGQGTSGPWCAVDFQSPGPFATVTTVVVP